MTKTWTGEELKQTADFGQRIMRAMGRVQTDRQDVRIGQEARIQTSSGWGKTITPEQAFEINRFSDNIRRALERGTTASNLHERADSINLRVRAD